MRGRSGREIDELVQQAWRRRKRPPLLVRFLRFVVLLAAGGTLGLLAVPLLPDLAQQWVAETQDNVGAWFDQQLKGRDSVLLEQSGTPPAAASPTPIVLGRLTPVPPIGTASPTPSQDAPLAVQRLSSSELAELRGFALGLINQDREDHGLLSVAMGSNPAAQLHAEDMLSYEYLGHWWVDGRKPYMVYTETGGTSYVAENAAVDGWISRDWLEKRCDTLLVDCAVRYPEASIRDLQWRMMYDDAHSDWGHRDNILRATHRSVNLGIAWNGRFLTFAQHFEGGDVSAEGPPQLGADGTLTLALRKVAPGIEIGSVVAVFHDPLPTTKSPKEIDELHSYCVGGGFTTECGAPVARVLRPPGAGRSYSNLDANEIVATSWAETATSFRLAARLGALAEEPGVYTVLVWQDSGGSRLTEQLLELTATRR